MEEINQDQITNSRGRGKYQRINGPQYQVFGKKNKNMSIVGFFFRPKKYQSTTSIDFLMCEIAKAHLERATSRSSLVWELDQDFEPSNPP